MIESNKPITREDLQAAKDEAVRAQKRHRQLKEEFAEQECPLAEGQEIEIVGFSHRGKRMIVDSIHPPRMYFYGDWEVSGRVINKNGKPGSVIASVNQEEWDKSRE